MCGNVNKCSNDESCEDFDTNDRMNENRLVEEAIEKEKISEVMQISGRALALHLRSANSMIKS